MKKDGIKAIIFDVGGVLDKGTFYDHYIPMCNELRINLKDFHKAYHKYSYKARVGKISTKVFISSIAKSLKISYKKLLECWVKQKRKSLKKDIEVEKTLNKLRKRYILGALTNVIELHDRIRIEKGFYKMFKYKICSYQAGACKPQVKFYKMILKKLKNIKPEEMIFIDDVRVCLKPAKKLGMKIILFKNNKQLVKELRKLNVEI